MKTISFKATDAEYEVLNWALKNHIVRSGSEGIRAALHLWFDDLELPQELKYQLERQRVTPRHRYR